jgi:hypothetical protein
LAPTAGYVGVAVGDVDGDGTPDLFFTGAAPPDGASEEDRSRARLYINDGTGAFVDSSLAWGFNSQTAGKKDLRGPVFADYDGDGDLDLFVAALGTNLLLRHDGNSFTDISEATQFGAADDESWAISLADFDSDGRLDAYVLNHVFPEGPDPDFNLAQPQDRLLKGLGDGSFTDWTAHLPAPDRGGAGFVATWTDLDEDGDLDLYIANDLGPYVLPNQLFINEGSADEHLGFTRRTEDCGCGLEIAAMGTAVGDYDRDGHKDLFISNLWDAGREVMLKGVGDGSFIDVSATVGVQRAESELRQSSWGVEFLDFDNDGWEDLFIAYSGGPGSSAEGMAPAPNLLLRNEEGVFTPVSNSGVDGSPEPTICAAVLDLELDGCLDVIALSGHSHPSLYRNTCQGDGNWIGFHLEGAGANRSAIGAVVRIQTAQGERQGEVFGGSTSICAARWKAVHFGLGEEDEVNLIEVRWPSGTTEHLGGLSAGKYYRLREGEGVVDAS